MIIGRASNAKVHLSIVNLGSQRSGENSTAAERTNMAQQKKPFDKVFPWT